MMKQGSICLIAGPLALFCCVSPAMAHDLDSLNWATRLASADCQIIYRGKTLLAKGCAVSKQIGPTKTYYAVNVGRKAGVLAQINPEGDDKDMSNTIDLFDPDDNDSPAIKAGRVTWRAPCWSNKDVQVCVKKPAPWPGIEEDK